MSAVVGRIPANSLPALSYACYSLSLLPKLLPKISCMLATRDIRAHGVSSIGESVNAYVATSLDIIDAAAWSTVVTPRTASER